MNFSDKISGFRDDVRPSCGGNRGAIPQGDFWFQQIIIELEFISAKMVVK
jgi:hypothetical protein